jgi:hypothetical protein
MNIIVAIYSDGDSAVRSTAAIAAALRRQPVGRREVPRPKACRRIKSHTNVSVLMTDDKNVHRHHRRVEAL